MMTETSITVSPSEGAPHVKTDPGQGQSSLGGVSLNLDYFKTVPGILKLLQAEGQFLGEKFGSNKNNTANKRAESSDSIVSSLENIAPGLVCREVERKFGNLKGKPSFESVSDRFQDQCPRHQDQAESAEKPGSSRPPHACL
ncbi:hypothetical protein RUM43_005671 [Polyplax serrata]|uniref:Uncharacterized protein n=1 Tax=Polyplax serrata TaxID=468196 RepID=A0AAN8S8Q5_POLSC